jgi:hypothetical protein
MFPNTRWIGTNNNTPAFMAGVVGPLVRAVAATLTVVVVPLVATMIRPSNAAVAIGSLVSERDWQRQVTEAAELFGWQWAHFRPARTERGWRTPVSGPLGAGYPDLILARPGQLLFAELKAEGAHLAPPQRAVHEALKAAGAEVHTWRPSDLPAVLNILKGEPHR